ncbi:hypothetical protein HYH02_002266 [Chlamydomonas schloesseri]|nr:hypothetical protein HYH02_002266 [Chlamydomonas schloesseri]|eukprot:KAG2452923.1 hypothetical protein HYH02_002266 [Chlamydomonas schloesseri]
MRSSSGSSAAPRRPTAAATAATTPQQQAAYAATAAATLGGYGPVLRPHAAAARVAAAAAAPGGVQPGADAGAPGASASASNTAAAASGEAAADLYEVLGVSRGATDTQLRRAYRNLLTRAHPDKPGGDAAAFRAVQRAYDVLSDPDKRRVYDSTGVIQKSPDQEFLERFAGGAYDDPRQAAAAAATDGSTLGGGGFGGGGSMADQIIVRHRATDFQSHTAGFEAWLRSRGGGGGTAGRVYTAESVAEQFGVARHSYDPVLLPRRANVLQVVCRGGGGGQLGEALALQAAPLPAELEWGHVLVAMK